MAKANDVEVQENRLSRRDAVSSLGQCHLTYLRAVQNDEHLVLVSVEDLGNLIAGTALWLEVTKK